MGPPVPSPVRAYFAQRLRIRVFNFILEKFVAAQEQGLTKAHLSRRIGKTPDLINRWLAAPANLTIDTISDLLLGISGEELELHSSSPFNQTQNNYSHYHFLTSSVKEHDQVRTQETGDLSSSALNAAMSDYAQRQQPTLAAAQ
jgi:hypothetical protein